MKMKNDEVKINLRRWILVRVGKTMLTKAIIWPIFGPNGRNKNWSSLKAPHAGAPNRLKDSQSKNRNSVFHSLYLVGKPTAKKYYQGAGARAALWDHAA